MKIKDGFLLRPLGGDYVVVPVGKAALDLQGMITLNETGAFLWQALGTPQTTETLVTAMCKEYDVTKERARQDVLLFLDKLQQQRLLDE